MKKKEDIHLPVVMASISGCRFVISNGSKEYNTFKERSLDVLYFISHFLLLDNVQGKHNFA